MGAARAIQDHAVHRQASLLLAGGDMQRALALAARQQHHIAARFRPPHIREGAALYSADVDILSQHRLGHAVSPHQLHHPAQHRIARVALIEKPAAITGRQQHREEDKSQNGQAAPQAAMMGALRSRRDEGHEPHMITALGLAQSGGQTRIMVPEDAPDDPISAAEALIAGGQAHAAARSLRARLADGRGGALARVTLVKALLACGDVEGALAEAREAVSLNPQLPAVLVALGEALLAAENLPAAIGELQRALRLDPDHAQARFLTGRAWAAAGEADKALEVFTQLDPDTPGLAAWMMRAEAMKSAARSDPGYVRHLFDQFSADYDARMRGALAYAAPEILGELAGMVMHGRTGLRVLDLGCGTGLAGAVFRARAARLDGLDLSPAMVTKARAKELYDHLAVGDIETALAAPGPPYDLIVAADTLVYLGDLAALLRGVRARLEPDGYFLFTVEAGPEDFALGPKRRWRHSEAYLRRAAGEAGFVVAGLVEASPRTEAQQPVAGFAVALAAG